MATSKKNLKICAVILITFVLLSFVGWKFFQSNKSGEEDISSLEKGVITNIAFPNADLTDSSNNPFQIENIKNGKVVLVYLLDGCDACSDQVSIISNLQKRAGLDTKVWGIVRESSNKQNNSNEQDTNIPLIVDKGDKLREELKIKTFPYNLLLKDGVIVKKWIGAKDEETFLNQINN